MNPPNRIKIPEIFGGPVLDSLGMLVNQGVIGIRHWIGVDPDSEIMRQKLEEILGA
jgi:shikimate dehydrogenase